MRSITVNEAQEHLIKSGIVNNIQECQYSEKFGFGFVVSKHLSGYSRTDFKITGSFLIVDDLVFQQNPDRTFGKARFLPR